MHRLDSTSGSWGYENLLFPVALSLTSDKNHRIIDMGLVHRVVCPFTPQLSLVLINQPQKDGKLSWHWYTVAAGRI